MWSCSEPGAHAARVIAIGPSSSWFLPADFQLPRPRLQSMRASTLPSALNRIVYFDLSSGASTAPSPPRYFTSCQAVPPRLSRCAQPNARAANRKPADLFTRRLSVGSARRRLDPRQQRAAQRLAAAELGLEFLIGL